MGRDPIACVPSELLSPHRQHRSVPAQCHVPVFLSQPCDKSWCCPMASALQSLSCPVPELG